MKKEMTFRLLTGFGALAVAAAATACQMEIKGGNQDTSYTVIRPQKPYEGDKIPTVKHNEYLLLGGHRYGYSGSGVVVSSGASMPAMPAMGVTGNGTTFYSNGSSGYYYSNNGISVGNYSGTNGLRIKRTAGTDVGNTVDGTTDYYKEYGPGPSYYHYQTLQPSIEDIQMNEFESNKTGATYSIKDKVEKQYKTTPAGKVLIDRSGKFPIYRLLEPNFMKTR